MTTQSRNQTARLHGEQGEIAAVVWLKDRAPSMQVKIINHLLDLLAGETYIEVKSCAATIASEIGKPPRAGRFTMEPVQHLSLVQVSGYYLFVVLHEVIPPTLFLVYAKDLEYRRQISWTTAYKTKTAFSKTAIGRN